MLNRMLRPQLFHPAFSLVGARHVVPSSSPLPLRVSVDSAPLRFPFSFSLDPSRSPPATPHTLDSTKIVIPLALRNEGSVARNLLFLFTEPSPRATCPYPLTRNLQI